MGSHSHERVTIGHICGTRPAVHSQPVTEMEPSKNPIKVSGSPSVPFQIVGNNDGQLIRRQSLEESDLCNLQAQIELTGV